MTPVGIRAPRVSSVRMASSVPPRLSWIVVGPALILSGRGARTGWDCGPGRDRITADRRSITRIATPERFPPLYSWC
jgi:hypothetical protein